MGFRWRWRRGHCHGRKGRVCPRVENLTTLDELRTGEEGTIVKILGNGAFRQRLLEMGFLPGTRVRVIRYAPLEDPVEYEIKGYHVALRHEEAAKVLVEKCPKS
ncbi:FeoA family protein [Thermosulfurimonas sp. F29]|uniref:FeoA family protein n=1 Tax=Thermosulfurimonas sp. F29 TaxID=2867247 RepID=UPI001C82FABB|nr:FeoA family protein [Thermosulfurimonas sp. F29]MBX6423017.1 ferrous iron transport protein A [Thermosulfurimonas sp. F29]